MARIFSFIFAFLLLGVAIQAAVEQKRDIYTAGTTFSTEGSSSSATSKESLGVSSGRTSATSVGASRGETTESSGATTSEESSDVSVGATIGVSSAASSATSVGETSDQSEEQTIGVTSASSQGVTSFEVSAESAEITYEEVQEDSSAAVVGESSAATSAESLAETSDTTKDYTTEESSAESSDQSEEESSAESTVYTEGVSSETSVGTSSVESSKLYVAYSVGETSAESTIVERGFTVGESSAESSEDSSAVSSATQKLENEGSTIGYTVEASSAESEGRSTVYGTERLVKVTSDSIEEGSTQSSAFTSTTTAIGKSSTNKVAYSTAESSESSYAKSVTEDEQGNESSSEAYSSATSVGTTSVESTSESSEESTLATEYTSEEATTASTKRESSSETDVTSSSEVVSLSSGETTATSSEGSSAVSSAEIVVESSEASTGVSSGTTQATSSEDSTFLSSGTTQETSSAGTASTSQDYTVEESSAESVGTLSNTVKGVSVGSTIFESSATSQGTTSVESSAESRDATVAVSVGVTAESSEVSSRGVSTLSTEGKTSESSSEESSAESSAESTEASTGSTQFVSSEESSADSSEETSEESSQDSTFSSEGFTSAVTVGATTEDTSEESSAYSDAETSEKTSGETTDETAEISYRYETDAPLQATVLQFNFVEPEPYNVDSFLADLAQAAQTDVSNLRLRTTEGNDGSVATLYFTNADPNDQFVASYNLYKFLKSLPTGVKRDLTTYGITSPQMTGFADPVDNNCAALNSAACGKDQQFGECVDSDDNGAGFCDCYSGRSGNQCNVELTAYAPYQVESNAAGFNATFDFNAEDSVTFFFRVPSVPRYSATVSYGLTTFITFSTVDTSCNYPDNKRWAISTENQDGGNTNDVYSATFTYNELVDCGLKNSGEDGTHHIFNSTVSLLRKFKLIKDIFSLDRTASNSFTYAILFPSKTSVQTTIEVVDNDLVQFLAVTDSSFDVVGDKWSLTFTSLTRAPYQLKLTENNHTILPADFSRVLDAESYVVTSCLGTPSTTDHCEQHIVVKASGCQVLSFALTLGFEIECRSPNSFETSSPCVQPATTSISPTFNVLTSSSCPLEKESPIQDQAMASYKDAQFQQAEHYFGKSNHIYFAVAFDSPAVIASVQLDSVCIQKSGSSSEVCDLPFDDFNDSTGRLPSSMVLTSDLSGRTDSPVRSAFAVTGGDINVRVPLDPYQFTSVVIKANYIITYQGTFQKKRATFVGTANTALMIQLSGLEDASVIKQGQLGNKSSASAAYASVFAIVLAIACLVA